MRSGTWDTSKVSRRAREKKGAEFPLSQNSMIIRNERKQVAKKKRAPAAAGALSVKG